MFSSSFHLFCFYTQKFTKNPCKGCYYVACSAPMRWHSLLTTIGVVTLAMEREILAEKCGSVAFSLELTSLHLIDVAISKMNPVESAITLFKKWTSHSFPSTFFTALFKPNSLERSPSEPPVHLGNLVRATKTWENSELFRCVDIVWAEQQISIYPSLIFRLMVRFQQINHSVVTQTKTLSVEYSAIGKSTHTLLFTIPHLFHNSWIFFSYSLSGQKQGGHFCYEIVQIKVRTHVGEALH